MPAGAAVVVPRQHVRWRIVERIGTGEWRCVWNAASVKSAELIRWKVGVEIRSEGVRNHLFRPQHPRQRPGYSRSCDEVVVVVGPPVNDKERLSGLKGQNAADLPSAQE